MGILEALDQVENVALRQVVWESLGEEIIYHLGDAIQHGSKWSCKEAHNGSSSQELFFPFGKNVSIR